MGQSVQNLLCRIQSALFWRNLSVKASSLRMEVFIFQNPLPCLTTVSVRLITTDKFSVKDAATFSRDIFLSLKSFVLYIRSILDAPIGE